MPQDKTDGLGLIGGQKTGKTSALCRTVRADALDPDCALIVLMPKPGDALKALSMVPRGPHRPLPRPRAARVRHQPAAAPTGDAGDGRRQDRRGVPRRQRGGRHPGSSDRYLRQAAQAAIGASRAGAIEGAADALAHVPDADPGRARVPRADRRGDLRSTRASPTPRRSSGATCRTTCASARPHDRASSTRRATSSCACWSSRWTRCCAIPRQLDARRRRAQPRGADRGRQDGHVRRRQLPRDDAVHPEHALRHAAAPAAAARGRARAGRASRSTRRT